MTISSINAYNTDRPMDPRIDRTWAKQKDIDMLTEQVRILQERMATMERDFAYHVHNVETHVHKNEIGTELPRTTGYFKDRKKGL